MRRHLSLLCIPVGVVVRVGVFEFFKPFRVRSVKFLNISFVLFFIQSKNIRIKGIFTVGLSAFAGLCTGIPKEKVKNKKMDTKTSHSPVGRHLSTALLG